MKAQISMQQQDWQTAAWTFPLPTEINKVIDDFAPSPWHSLIQKFQAQELYRRKRLIIKIKALNFIARIRDQIMLQL